MTNKRKLNTLEQEILIQEEIAIANEINRLEFNISSNSADVVKNNRLRFWTFFFSSIFFVAVAVYALIIILIGDLIGLSLQFQRFLLIGSSVLLAAIPIINVLVWVSVSLHIRNKNAVYKRANQIMLIRLEKYYRLLKFELDPEKYKIWDDSFVVDIDENGNLIKYVRFYNDDGSITTKPFRDTKELRKFLDNNDAALRQKNDNKRLVQQTNKFMESSKTFNTFNMIDNNVISKAIIEDANINSTRFVKNNDYFPEHYENKVSKWFSSEDYNKHADFIRTLTRNNIDDATTNDDKVTVDAAWLKEQFDSKQKGSSIFFKQYDISKTLSEAQDVQTFVNMVRNFDLAKDPSINWEEAIDPKDINQEKKQAYEESMRNYETRALELTNEQLSLENELKHNNRKILRVALVDNVGIDTYNDVDPYVDIKKELEKQEKRVQEIAKTKALFLEHGLEEVNFDGLSIPELRKLAKIKIKEHEELQRLSKDSNVDEVVALENAIARIKGETFKEIHLPKEKYQRDDGTWEYHDGTGSYYESTDAGEWVLTEPAAKRFEDNKQNRIWKLQQQYNERQTERLERQKSDLLRKEKEIQDITITASEKKFKQQQHKKEMKAIKEQAKENKRLEIAKESEYKELQKNRVDEYQKQFDQANNPSENVYVETHPANEAFMNDEGQWMYHDGQENYYVSDDAGNWNPTSKPVNAINDKPAAKIENPLISDEKKKELELEEKQKLDAKSEKKRLKEESKKAKRDAKEIAKENQSSVDESNAIDSNNYTQEEYNQQEQVSATTTAQQWQDEYGTWWYLDEQGNYYYADETGNWIPYQASQ